MANKLHFLTAGSTISGLLLLLLGVLLIAGGRVGLQITGYEVHWMSIPKLSHPWAAWVVLWIGFDTIFSLKITSYILSKISKFGRKWRNHEK